MREPLRNGGGGSTEETEAEATAAEEEEEESSSSLTSGLRSTLGSARDRVSDTLGSESDDSPESSDTDTTVRKTSERVADNDPEPARESETESASSDQQSSSDEQSSNDGGGIRDRVSDAVDTGREIARDPGGAAEDAAEAVQDAPDEVRETAGEVRDRVEEVDTDQSPSVDAGTVDATGEISQFEAGQVESQLRSDVANELDDVDEEDVTVERRDDAFTARVESGSEAVTVAELTEDDFAQSAAEQMDQVSRQDLGVQITDGSIAVFADEGVQDDIWSERLASDDPRVDAEDVDLERDGDQFNIQVTDESAQRLESGVSGTDAREAFGSLADGFTDSVDDAGSAFAPAAAGAAFELETARRAVGNPAERLPGVDSDQEYPDSVPDRARSTEETAPRDEFRQQVAEDTRFDEDEITVGFDVSSGQLEADVRDEVVEEEVRQEVLDDIEGGFLGSQAGVDPERVQVERTEDGVEVDIQRESGISGVGAIIRGEQTSRDFLVAEDERFVDAAGDVGDVVRGENSNTRQLVGAGTETGLAFASPAGGVLFAEDAGQYLSDSVQPGIGGTGIRLDVGEEDTDAARRIGEGAVEAFRDDPVEASGSAAGAAFATLAPIGAPRVGRAARNRSPDFDFRFDEFRRDQTAQLNKRQRRSSQSSQAEQRTISRDSPEADPSDPTVSERVDQITERWGGEGTMTRPDRGLDEAIVVEPQQRGRQQRSPEDQLPPREEFPSDAAYQRELEAVRDRMRSQDVDARTATQEATADSAVPGEGGRTTAVEEFGLRRRQQQEVTADSAVPQGGRTRAAEDMGSRFSQRQTAATALAVPGEQLTESAQADAQMDLLQVQDQQSQIDVDTDAALGARLDTDSLFGSMTATRSDSLFDSTQTQVQGQTQTQVQSQTETQQQQFRTQQRSRPRRPRFDLPDEADGQIQTGFDEGRDAGWYNPIERLGGPGPLEDELEPPEEGQSWRWF